jgi:hypothetical protein
MCLAIYKPRGLTIPKQYLMSGYMGNRSGCGFMFHDQGKLHVFKKMAPFTEFYEAYKEIEKDHDVAVHFRAATHGPRNDANCHPFVMCDGQFAMIHNGIFDIDLKNRELSDTGNFCEQILEPAVRDGSYLEPNPNLQSLHPYRLEKHPRWGWGMVVLMNADGEVIIYNKDQGRMDEGVWYSNGGYRWGRFEERDEPLLVPYETKPHDGLFFDLGCDW